MKEKFFSLWESIGAKGDAFAVYCDLQKRYGEPHRHYHNLTHVDTCLAELKEVQQLVENYPAVAMAIWFHDAVYDPKAGNNEERSASLAFITLEGAFLNYQFRRRVLDLILATKHLSPPTDPDEKIIVDIDLSSFGWPAEKFDQNTRLIRQEYNHVPEAIFAKERAKILKLFLDRKPLYCTEFFRNKYEMQAKQNLERAVAQLSR